MAVLFPILDDVRKACQSSLASIPVELRSTDSVYNADPPRLIVVSPQGASPIASGSQPQAGSRKSMTLIDGKKATTQSYGITVYASIYDRRSTPQSEMSSDFFGRFETLWAGLHAELWPIYGKGGIDIEPVIVVDPQAFQLSYDKFTISIGVVKSLSFQVS